MNWLASIRLAQRPRLPAVMLLGGAVMTLAGLFALVWSTPGPEVQGEAVRGYDRMQPFVVNIFDSSASEDTGPVWLLPVAALGIATSLAVLVRPRSREIWPVLAAAFILLVIIHVATSGDIRTTCQDCSLISCTGCVTEKDTWGLGKWLALFGAGVVALGSVWEAVQSYWRATGTARPQPA